LLEAEVQPQNPPPPPPAPSTIFWEDKNSYRVGTGPSYPLTDDEDRVLRALANFPAMRSKDLANESGVKRPGKILRRLVQKYDGCFLPAIRFLDRQGYAADVRYDPRPEMGPKGGASGS
jgi:hypothetical protein